MLSKGTGPIGMRGTAFGRAPLGIAFAGTGIAFAGTPGAATEADGLAGQGEVLLVATLGEQGGTAFICTAVAPGPLV